MRRCVLIVALLVVGCSSRERADNPEGAVHLFIAAARSGDRAAVYQRLGPATRQRIETLLTSSQYQGGRNIARPEDFFSVGWAPPAWEPAGVRTVHREGERAEVEVYSAAGDRHSLTLVREGKEWKIELPWG
jgi:monoamine oxidase